jgi:hypothetical protein
LHPSALLSRPTAICSDLITVYEGLLSAANGRRQYAASWSDFGRKSVALITSELPQLRPDIERICALFDEFAQIHLDLAIAEERNSDDIRDVVERFAILFRDTEVHHTESVRYTDALQNLERVMKAKSDPDQPFLDVNAKLLQDEMAAKAEFQVARERYARTLEGVIAIRAGYHEFKIKRIRHGWTVYIEAMKQAAEKEMDVLARIQSELGGLSLDAPPPQAIASVVDAALGQVEENLSKE